MQADLAAIRQSLADALDRIPTSDDDVVLGSTDTEIVAGDGTLQLGRSGQGELVALVPATPDTTGLPSRSGLSLTVQLLRPGPEAPPSPYLVLTCHRAHLEPTFLDLVASMAERFVESPDNAAETMHRQYVRWRELFADVSRSGLTLGQTAGLVGELLSLRQLCEEVGPGALDMWHGPLGARHDFLDGSDALEVKAVLTNVIERVGIHGVEQLLAPPGGTLHVAVFRLEAATGDISISSICADLVQHGGVDPLSLRELLHGLDVELESEVATRSWLVAEQRLYAVDGAFPRVVPSSFARGAVPTGVSDLRYAVSLAGVEPVSTGDVASCWAERVGAGE